MKVQIAKWGNSAAVRLPKAVLEQLGVDAGAELDLVLEGRSLRLSPPSRQPSMDEVVAEMKRLGGAGYDHGQYEWPEEPLTEWPLDEPAR
jgi:antitoxin MazE